jgi:hydrogenase/urease accessory protein HupE
LFYECNKPFSTVNIDYTLFQNSEALHENFISINLAGRKKSETLSRLNPEVSIDVAELLQAWRVELPDKFSDAPSGLSLQGANVSNLNVSYLGLGVEHILKGYDHLLFVIGLILLPIRFSRLAWMITSFTLAHSITLSLASFNILSFKPAFVESVIALSICYVALENIWLLRRSKVEPLGELRASNLGGERVITTGLFGLVHGFGFAYVLQEIGLGEDVFFSLLMFNLGVELGQLAVISCIFPFIFILYKRKHSPLIAKIFSLLIGLFGGWWFVERAILV